MLAEDLTSKHPATHFRWRATVPRGRDFPVVSAHLLAHGGCRYAQLAARDAQSRPRGTVALHRSVSDGLQERAQGKGTSGKGPSGL